MRKVMALRAGVAALLTVGVCGATAPASRADSMQPVGSVPIPDGPAQTWIVADLDSGQVLAGRDQNVAHPPASTIKVLLALVTLDQVSLDSTVVADAADTQVECNCVGVKPGHLYTARQLLDGLLLVSGNDAANTLAHMLGGPEATVAKMNAKAASLGATSTHAATPSGLDGPGGSGSSTAHDLAVIFRAAMANPVFAHITAEPSAMFPGDPASGGDHLITNQDELLQRYPGAIGGKTGFTDAARKTFVGAAARGGRRLVIAMMYGLVKAGGPSYWDQAATLFDWGFALNPQSSIGSL
ncbi:D-alanyl-D-alanine carboxypeptidase [Mycobacterium malmoense]|uniref:D-alanyl-D-alanine carboxypeptidase n=1 Tax=Mycobacterium malmoense TaxID=1780 RepID=A0A1B9D996_MYCMA|nr:D-alanyl-D-alanine carboxypeptidase family protein [Mycobacterium malmoense]OCB20453.1 D-alanyl-D-alanine carboxypeptidase [Mycobacterium malmoense]OCB32767.1 D-alanyl-D-alanine carboxypeptidase [Mycobacterium malmoense]OCB34256.1 D-alanyl-D-alanine carboxypeptidase [Mycobacterium malmoense]OCB55734.1 D-alanyl-D-alanine carboxypeptidase [Mycobacterium malmoense]